MTEKGENHVEKTIPFGIRLAPDEFEELEKLSNTNFEANRNKAVKFILNDFFRHKKKALSVLANVDENRTIASYL